MHALFRFMALHPSLYAFNVQSPDGNRIIWSTIRQPKRPITMASGFTPLPAHAGYLLGRPRFASRVHSYAITMRYRASGPDGRTRYFVGTPYRLDRLFAFPNRLRTPLALSVIDLRNHRELATWRSGRLDFSEFNKRDTGVAGKAGGRPLVRGRAGIVPVPGLPLEIAAGWPRNVVFDDWVRTGRLRWAVEALFVGVMALLVLLVDRGRRREQRAAEAIERVRTTDEATGLSTRAMFEERIPGLCDALGPCRQLAVIVIDIEGFTEINARHGRKAGDRILRALAERLRALPDARLLARVGADSFAFVHVGILEREIHARIDAALAVVETPFDISAGVAETLKLSLGSALYPADTGSAAALLGRAEVSIFGQIQRQYGIRRRDLDPYSQEYHAMLGWGWRFLNHLIPDLAAGVFDDFAADARNVPIIQSLGTERARRRKWTPAPCRNVARSGIDARAPSGRGVAGRPHACRAGDRYQCADECDERPLPAHCGTEPADSGARQPAPDISGYHPATL
jgi:diguanylate cyclase (GGDEF)-like protein